MCVKITVKPTESGSICLQSSLLLGVHSNCVVIGVMYVSLGVVSAFAAVAAATAVAAAFAASAAGASAAATESVAASAQPPPPQQQQQQLQPPQARSPQCGGASLISMISQSSGVPHIRAQVAPLSSHVNPPFSHLSW